QACRAAVHDTANLGPPNGSGGRVTTLGSCDVIVVRQFDVYRESPHSLVLCADHDVVIIACRRWSTDRKYAVDFQLAHLRHATHPNISCDRARRINVAAGGVAAN